MDGPGKDGDRRFWSGAILARSHLRKHFSTISPLASAVLAWLFRVHATLEKNLIRAGVSEHVAMRIIGHKTRSVFDRYDIVSERDLTEGIEKLAKFHGQETPGMEEKIVEEEKKIAVAGGGRVISFPGRR